MERAKPEEYYGEEEDEEEGAVSFLKGGDVEMWKSGKAAKWRRGGALKNFPACPPKRSEGGWKILATSQLAGADTILRFFIWRSGYTENRRNGDVAER
jgi:hypothetical protein